MERSTHDTSVSKAKRTTTAILVALFVFPFLGAAEAATSPSTVPASPWDGPWNPTISESESARFVDLWAPRVLDNPWFNQWVKTPGVPPEIQAEGFHGLDIHTKMYLVHKLFDHFLTIPQFNAQIAGYGVDGTSRLHEMESMMTIFIFAKQTWQDAITAAGTPPADMAQPLAPPVDANPFEAVVEKLRVARDVQLDNAMLPPELAAPLAKTLTSEQLFATRSAPPARQWSGDLTANSPVTLAPLPEATTVPGAPPPMPNVNPPDVTTLLGVARDVVDSSTYKACAISLTGVQSCSADAPLGSVVPLDVTGDLVPDVLVHLAPTVDQAFPLGFAAKLDVKAVDPLQATPRVVVFSVFEVPTTFKRLSVGFDGRVAGLPSESALQFTLKDTARALTGDVQGGLLITLTSPPGPTGVVFSIKDLAPTSLLGVVPGLGDPTESNPMAGELLFAPAPSSFKVDVDIARGSSGDTFTFDVASSLRSVVTASIVSDHTSSNSRNAMGAVVDKVPTNLHLAFLQASGGVGATHAVYSGDGTVDHFAFADKLTQNLNVPTTFRQLTADVLSIPKNVSFDLTPPLQVDYHSSATVGKVVVGMAEYTSNVLQRSIAGDATSIPTSVHLDVSTGATTSVTYAASSVIPTLHASFFDKASTTAADLIVSNIPTQMTMTQSGQAISFSANDPIGSVVARFAKAGGTVGTLAGDHALFVKNGAALALDAKLSGIKAFTADPTNGGYYKLTLSPGGQPFTGIASIDGDVSVQVDITNLPSTLTLDLRPGINDFAYNAAAPISGVTAQMTKASTGLSVLVDLASLPASLDLSWTTGTAPVVTYSASGALGRLHAFVQQSTGGAAFDATITSIPPYMQVAAGSESVSFDARSSAGAAPGSASIGTILVMFGSNGAFLTGTSTNDHIAFAQTATVTQAELLYSGLEAFSFNSAGGNLHVNVQNSAPRTFSVSASTVAMLVSALIDQVPSNVTLDYSGTLVKYRASTPINEVSFYADKLDGQFANVDILGVPASIDMDLNLGGQSITWTASQPITSISVSARVIANSLNWDAVVQIVGVPSQWDLSFNSGNPRFRGISGALGSVTATLTNHGAVTTFGGNHLSAVYNAGTGALDASFRMTSINLVQVDKTASGLSANLKMGGGQSFYVNVDINQVTSKALIHASISNLPTSIQVTQNSDVFSYTSNANFDLNAYTEVGNVAGVTNAPAPPSIRGLSVRDGSGCVGTTCGAGVKANLYLQGFPTGFSADAKNRVVTVTNFAPPADIVFCYWFGCFTIDRDSLSLNVDLHSVVATPVTLTAYQNTIPSPVSFTFGPMTESTLSDGSKQTTASYTSTAALGPLTADIVVGTSVGHLEVSNIPSSMSATITVGHQTSTVAVTTAQSISRIYAAAKTATTDASYGGAIELLQIPTSMSLSFGRVTVNPASGESYTMPGMSYTANADTLDINAFVDATLFGGDLQARARLNVVDLGRSVTMGMSGRDLNLFSTPATNTLEIHVWGQYRILKYFSGCVSSCSDWLRLEYGDHAGITPLTVTDMSARWTGVSSFTMKLGITSAITGNYGGFTFNWGTVTAQLNIYVYARAVADFGWLGCICQTIASYSDNRLLTVNVLFHMATNHMSSGGALLNAGGGIIPCGPWYDPWGQTEHIVADVKPHPHYAQWNGFSTSSGSAEGGGWLMTPNPWGVLPYAGVWIVAGFTSPLGGGFALGTQCY